MRRTLHRISAGRRRRPGRFVAAALTALAVASSPAWGDPVAVDFVLAPEPEPEPETEAEADADLAVAVRTLEGTVAEGHLSLELVLLDASGEPVAKEDLDPDLVTIFQVQRSLDADFAEPVVHHDGPATVVFVSGLPDGEHRFRVRGRSVPAADFEARAAADEVVADTAWGRWSEPASFVVRHQPMSLAWTLFAGGAVLFVALVVIVVQGSRDPHRGLDRPADGGSGGSGASGDTAARPAGPAGPPGPEGAARA